MTKVKVKYENDVIENVCISGHSGYDIFGKDIVCASISSIVTFAINLLLRVDPTFIDYTQSDGNVTIKVLKREKICNIILLNMIDLLKDLESQYKKNIKIIEEV